MTVASYFNKWFGAQRETQTTPSGASLLLTDGEVSVDLADTGGDWFLLSEGWPIEASTFKGKGAYADNKAADARYLKQAVFDSVTESLRLGLIFHSADDLTYQIRKLENLIKVRAPRYWTQTRKYDPVYLKVTFAGGTDVYYALISQGDLIIPDDVFDVACTLANGRMWPVALILERQPFWLRAAPGQTQAAVSLSSQQAWDYNLGWTVDSSLPSGQVYCFIEADDGTIYAGGASEILEFDGSSWSVSTTSPVTLSADVTSAVKLNNGDILFGESGRIIKLSGGTWSVETSEPTGAVTALLQYSTGEVYAGDSGRILKRDLSGTWAEDDDLPDGAVYSLLESSSGFIFAGEPGRILRTAEQATETEVDYVITQGTDDAQQQGTTCRTTDNDFDLFQDTHADHLGLRFQNVAIPQGATINSAVVRFTAEQNATGAPDPIKIYCEDTDDASTFSNSSNDISNRTLTTAYTEWSNPEAWYENLEYDTPDISTIIQEVVDRGGWSSGNSLAIIFTDINTAKHRDAYTYDNDPGKAAQLIITYSESLPAGSTWEINSTLPSGDIRAMVQVGERIIAADSGQFLSTTDDGESWGVLDSTPTGQLLALYKAGGNVLWAGENGSILKSTDMGVTWAVDDNSTPSGDVEDFIMDGEDIYAADDGQILTQDSTAVVSLGQAATTKNQVFLANHHKTANLTNAYIDDGGVFSSIFPLDTADFPQELLPAVPATGDAIYFGIDTSLDDTGPFCSLIFDIATPASATTSYTIVWEYYNGAWTTLTTHDETSQLSETGVRGVFWEQPSDWTTTAVNSVTGYWVRARLSALTGTLTPPTQQNRDIYSAIVAFAQVAATQINGAIDALMKVNLNNRSAADGPGGSNPLLYQNRIWAGVKPVSGHESFRAFLNLADEQNPDDVTVDVSVDADSATSIEDDTNLSSATGRRTFFDASVAGAGAGLDNMADRVAIDLATTVTADYYGTYRAFLRVKQNGGTAGDVSVRIKTVFGSGGATALTDTQVTETTNDHHLLVFAQPINLPISQLITSDEVADEISLVIQIASADSAADLYLYDLFLLPTDTVFIDSRDLRNNANSAVENQKRLLVDSITIPKTPIRTLVQDTTSGVFKAAWRIDSPGPMTLPVDEQVRLWLLSARTVSTSDTTLISHPEAVVSVRGWKVEREL